MIDKELLRAVTDAVLELCCGDKPLKERLLSAIRALNVVLEQRQDWPLLLHRRAQELSDELRTGGTPEQTVAALDSQSARRLAERILHLYADCRITFETERS